MPGRTHEQTINTALGEVLQALGRDWTVRPEDIGRLFVGGGRPDLLIEKPGDWPVVIEAEVGNHQQAEAEARSRLGRRLVDNPRSVEIAIALVYPQALRRLQGEALRRALHDAEYEFAVVHSESDGTIKRTPESGWLSGNLTELAGLLHLLNVPASRVDALADVLAGGVTQAEGLLTAAHPIGGPLGQRIAEILRQSDDEEAQTRKMAMTVIANALVFHEALAEAELSIESSAGVRGPVRPPRNFRSRGTFLPTPLLDHWEAILKVNYWPIFHAAGAIIRELPSETASRILDVLWDTAEKLVAGGVTKSHDLTGIVFQRLIADRKFLATYYTRPAAASLLSTLALPLFQRPPGGETPPGFEWDDLEAVSRLRVGDFACGTGTLLSSTYLRLSMLHELHGGNPRQLHPRMMKQSLVGLDVLNIAVHLTAAMLAGTHPETPFEGECLLTLPYGTHEWGVSVGSLSLLAPQGSFEFMRAAAKVGGKGEEMVRDLLARVGHGQFDLLIMNPPFTRHGAREGERVDVHNPAFAAFEATEEEQTLLARELKRLAVGGAAHGHAGMASYFVELAHRKLSPGGTLALVLPLSAMSGASWDGVRKLWRDQYDQVRVVSIAESGSHSRSFSADTGMAECLVVARKRTADPFAPRNREHRAVFAVLSGQPETPLDGELVGHALNSIGGAGAVRRLEVGPLGGSTVKLGDAIVGEVIDCPLPEEGPWQMVGILSFDLAQTAYQLSQGKLWFEGMSSAEAPSVPVARVQDLPGRLGPHHLDLTGAEIKADGLPQGPFVRFDGVPPGSAYPCLWNHDASRERRLYVEPDSHCRIADVREGEWSCPGLVDGFGLSGSRVFKLDRRRRGGRAVGIAQRFPRGVGGGGSLPHPGRPPAGRGKREHFLRASAVAGCSSGAVVRSRQG